MIENYWNEPKAGALDRFAQFLRGSLEAADELSSAHAAAVHPQLRDPKRSERTTAKKFLEDYRIDPFFPVEYPARPNEPKVLKAVVSVETSPNKLNIRRRGVFWRGLERCPSRTKRPAYGARRSCSRR